MTTNSETKPTRRGQEVFEKNPFIADAMVNTKQGMRRITDKSGTRMMVVDSHTGDVMQTPVGFWHAQEVDKTQFVKLYINGVKAFKELTGSGTKVFEVVYLELQKQIGRDRIFLSFGELDQKATPMAKATYQRGLKELIQKGFLAPSLTQGWFFINPDYIFNGDRLAFVKEYKLRADPRDAKTVDMFDDGISARIDDSTKRLTAVASAKYDTLAEETTE